MNDIRRKIYNHILTQIAEKKLSQNDRIPTEFELAKQFQTKRMNAHLAVKMLEKEGIVRRNKRQGTFVNKNITSETILRLKNLSTNRVYVIASLAKFHNIHWNEATLRELEGILNSNGYKVFYKELPAKLTRQRFQKIFSKIKKVGSAALIIFPDRGESGFLKDNLDLIFDSQGEIYLFDRGSVLLDKWPFHSIRLDPFGEGVIVGKYLYGHGHRNIVFLKQNDTRYWIEERKNGLKVGLNSISKGKTKPDIWRFPKDSMYQKACQRIMESKVKLTIVVPNDEYAVRLIECAKKDSLEVPKDFSLISFDNNAEFRKYNLTTVAPPLERIGRVFGQLICKNQWLKSDGNNISIKVSSKIIERDSCK